MLKTASQAIEMLISGALILYNITAIQKLLNNYTDKNRFVPFLKILCLASGTLLAIFKGTETPHIIYPVISGTLFYALIFLIQSLFSSVSKKEGAYISFIYLTIDSIIQSLSLIITKIIITDTNNKYILSSSLYFSSILFGIICFILIKRTESTAERIRNSVRLLPKSIYILVLIALLLIGNLSANLSISLNSFNKWTYTNSILTILSILVFIAIIISLVSKSVSKEYYEDLSHLMEKTVEQQLKHYERIDALNEELRAFRHDYRNHMICLQSLLESKAYEEAEEYLQEITLQKVIENKSFFTGNSIADAILNDKNAFATDCGCTIVFSGCISDLIPSCELCTILSNSLDNSIESCSRIKKQSPFISIDCAVIQNVQIIKIQNPNNIDTTTTIKTDKRNHGFGLSNIRTAVEKLDGQMEIPSKSPIFSLEIEFPIRQIK
jgi:Signal transduction histidine kinase regulating citrate/malate metabolism